MIQMKEEALYLKIANTISDQIANETLKTGDKLPSIRAIQKRYNVSINTVKRAYLDLEGKSLIEPRAKSGYFVSRASARGLLLPSVGKMKSYEKDPEDLIIKVFNTLGNPDITHFAVGGPDHNLLPAAKLNKYLINMVRNRSDNAMGYEPVQGSINLRRTIAKWSWVFEGKLSEDDIVTTSGAMNAIFNCMMAVTKPGDTVAIETPAYFGIHQFIRSLGLKAVEIPTHPVTGIDLDALKKVLPRVNACCFMSNFGNPLGSLMPDENKRELVKMLTERNIPLIEDDIHGNLFFSGERPKPCKYYDEAGIVMWCSSVSKTLAPGYRVGWVAPGIYKEKIIRQKLVQTISTPSLFQETVADFLEHGGYDHHLHTLRSKLYTNCLKFQGGIAEYFPEDTKVSQPQGGFMLWLELNKKVDTAKLFDLAIKQKISFAPGRMFTQADQYNNCMRLNFASAWNDQLDDGLKRLGRLIKATM